MPTPHEEALLALVPDEQVTHFAAGAGLWSDPNSWQGGILPIDGAHVLVPAGAVLVVDSEVSQRLSTIRIDGTLSFAPGANTGLLVDTMVVNFGGVLLVGIEQTPIQPDMTATIVFTDDGPIDTAIDPLIQGRGLISLGSVRICGAAKTSHLGVMEYPRAGDIALSVDEVAGWRVGDEVLIPSVEYDVPDEVLTVDNTMADSVVLNGSLQRDHVPPRDTLEIRVANLTRNVMFRSENTTDPQRAGHVMIMHNSDASIKFASLEHIGRTDKSVKTTDPELDANGVLVPGTGDNARGRYAVHFHQAGPGSDLATVDGCVVKNSPGWGFVNHSSNVLFKNNVTFNVKGSGFVTEVGSEIGAFIDNMAVRSEDRRSYFPTLNASKDGSGTGFGSVGHGLWIQGGQIDVIGNVASGHAQEGIFFNSTHVSRSRPTIGLFETRFLKPGTSLTIGRQKPGGGITPNKVPYGRIENNTVFASGVGLGLWIHILVPAVESGEFGDVIDGLIIWNVKWHGIRMGYNGGAILRNVLVIGDGDKSITNGLETPKGIAGNVGTRDIKLENVEVRNWAIGIDAYPFNNTIIENAILANVVDIYIGVHGQTGFGSRNVFISNAQHEPFSDREYKVQFADDFVGNNHKWDYHEPNNVYHNGSKLYWHKQAADGVPFPNDKVPSWFNEEPYIQYIDKTQQQLQDEFGFVFAGEMAPSNATDGAADGINGFVLQANAINRYTFETNVISAPVESLLVAHGDQLEVQWTFRSTALPGAPNWRLEITSDSKVQAIPSIVSQLADDTWSIAALIDPEAHNIGAGRYAVMLNPQIAHNYGLFDKTGIYLSELEITEGP